MIAHIANETSGGDDYQPPRSTDQENDTQSVPRD
jgi:hypothetical protein